MLDELDIGDRIYLNPAAAEELLVEGVELKLITKDVLRLQSRNPHSTSMNWTVGVTNANGECHGFVLRENGVWAEGVSKHHPLFLVTPPEPSDPRFCTCGGAAENQALFQLPDWRCVDCGKRKANR